MKQGAVTCHSSLFLPTNPPRLCVAFIKTDTALPRPTRYPARRVVLMRRVSPAPIGPYWAVMGFIGVDW